MRQILIVFSIIVMSLNIYGQSRCTELIKTEVVVNIKGIEFKFSDTDRSAESLRLSIDSLLILMSKEESKFNQLFQDQKVSELQKYFSGSKDKFYRKIRKVRAVTPEVSKVKIKKNKIKRVKRSFVTGKEVVKFRANTSFLSSVYEISEGRLATGHGGHSIIIWERSGDSYKEVGVLGGHKSFVTAVIGVKGGRLATASRDKTVRIWESDGDTYKQVKVLKNKYPVESIVELRDGSLVTGYSSAAANVWRPTTGVFKKTWDGSYKVESTIGREYLDSARSIVEVHTGWLAIVSMEGVVDIWEQSKSYNRVTTLSKTANAIAQLSDVRLATASSNGSVRIWDWDNVSSYNEVATLEGHKHSLTSIIELKNRQIVTGAANGTVRIWHPDGESYKEAAVFREGQDKVIKLVQLADDSLLALFEDNTIMIWELEYGEEDL